MLSKNIKNRLISEFNETRNSPNHKLDPAFDAVAVLSGESLDPVTDVGLQDTEKRLRMAFKVYRKIERFHGKPFLILTGSSIQNESMLTMARENNIKRISILVNIPPAPNASTLDQFRGLKKTAFKNILIVTHAYHYPRSRRYAKKFLTGKIYDFFLIERKAMRQHNINQEIKKIIKYSRGGIFDLFPKKIVAIIQARMSSTRLPGKVMIKIGGKPMLLYVVERTKWAKSLDDILVATSRGKSDDVIIDFCKKIKINYFRGSLNNVLSRYYHAAKKNDAEVIIRITSDCPLVDGYLIDEGIKVFKNSHVDYLSNTIKRTFPRGLDFEIFTFEALKRAYLKAKDKPEREHVTPYIYNSSRFKIDNFKQNLDKSKYRITVDTSRDLEVIKILIEKYQVEEKGYKKIVAILDSHPEITAMNQEVIQKKYGE